MANILNDHTIPVHIIPSVLPDAIAVRSSLHAQSYCLPGFGEILVEIMIEEVEYVLAPVSVLIMKQNE